MIYRFNSNVDPDLIVEFEIDPRLKIDPELNHNCEINDSFRLECHGKLKWARKRNGVTKCFPISAEIKVHEPSVCDDQDFVFKVSNVFFPNEYHEGLDYGCYNALPSVHVALPDSGRPTVILSGKQSKYSVTAASMQNQVNKYLVTCK